MWTKLLIGFLCSCYSAQLTDITGAIPGEPFTFVCDATAAGWGEAKLDIVYRGRSIPHHIEEVSKGLYHVTFTPQDPGKHRVYTYYNGIEVKGITGRRPIPADNSFAYQNHFFFNKGNRTVASTWKLIDCQS
jgi:hypothetical protein